MQTWRNNGLSITLFIMFLFCLAGQSVSGHLDYNEEQREHGEAPVSYMEYVTSPAHLEATMENWESEFLQLASYVMLTAFLFQKGSAESKDPDRKEPVDRQPDPKRRGAPSAVRRGGIVLRLYENSLFICFTLLFLLSFYLHAVGGAGKHNEEELAHRGTDFVTAFGYMETPKFWFESFQNWQSEFLSIFAIVVLSVFLRQQYSPQSKPVDAPDSETGG